MSVRESGNWAARFPPSGFCRTCVISEWRSGSATIRYSSMALPLLAGVVRGKLRQRRIFAEGDIGASRAAQHEPRLLERGFHFFRIFGDACDAHAKEIGGRAPGRKR